MLLLQQWRLLDHKFVVKVLWVGSFKSSNIFFKKSLSYYEHEFIFSWGAGQKASPRIPNKSRLRCSWLKKVTDWLFCLFWPLLTEASKESSKSYRWLRLFVLRTPLRLRGHICPGVMFSHRLAWIARCALTLRPRPRLASGRCGGHLQKPACALEFGGC